MNKPVIILALVFVPVLLILAGFYFKNEILSSIGYVILIFYIIMVIRGRFANKKSE